jgi:phosphotransferase system IIA component
MTAPVSGKCVPLHAVYSQNSSFSSLGSGIAILPSEGTVSAPFDCVVARVSESRRCVILCDTVSNHEVLIAADFRGSSEAFKLMVQPGQLLKKGDILFTMDFDTVNQGIGSVTVPCVFSSFNTTDGMDIVYGDTVRGETTILTCAG